MKKYQAMRGKDSGAENAANWLMGWTQSEVGVPSGLGKALFGDVPAAHHGVALPRLAFGSWVAEEGTNKLKILKTKRTIPGHRIV